MINVKLAESLLKQRSALNDISIYMSQLNTILGAF